MSDDIKQFIEKLDQKQDEQTCKLIEISFQLNKNSEILNKHENKYEEIDKVLSSISKELIKNNIILQKQEKNIDEHIKRTNLLEEKLEPVEKHVHLMNTLSKIIVGLTGIIGTIIAIISLFKK
jgi:hypothetical protein